MLLGLAVVAFPLLGNLLFRGKGTTAHGFNCMPALRLNTSVGFCVLAQQEGPEAAS